MRYNVKEISGLMLTGLLLMTYSGSVKAMHQPVVREAKESGISATVKGLREENAHASQRATEKLLKLHGEDSLIIYRNLRYGSRPDAIGSDTSSDRMLDLYMPANRLSRKLPVFLFIHGGGFRGGDKKGTEALCSRLSSYGFAVISINYRLWLKNKKIAGSSATANMSKGLPATGKFHPALHEAIHIASEDAVMAMKWINENDRKYKLNSRSIAISGGSAGAMTALYTAYISGQKVARIGAVVDLWGGLENTELIQKGAPPVLIYHGDQDKLINVEYAYTLKNKMESIGNDESVLHVMKGKGHARYDVITKDKTGEIAAFLKKTLK